MQSQGEKVKSAAAGKGVAVPVIAVVKVDEFEGVAPYIRGRLTREQVQP